MKEGYVVVTDNLIGTKLIDWDSFSGVVNEFRGRESELLVLGEGLTLGALVYPRLEGEDKEVNQYVQRLGKTVTGIAIVFGLDGNNPVPLSHTVATKVELKANPSKLLNRREDGYLLLSPINKEFLVLPEAPLDDYLEYYMKGNAIPIQLKRFSETIGTQVTLWADKSKEERSSSLYNVNATNLISHQLLSPVLVLGTAILSTRYMHLNLVANYGTFPLTVLEKLSWELTFLEDFQISGFRLLSQYLKEGKEV